MADAWLQLSGLQNVYERLLNGYNELSSEYARQLNKLHELKKWRVEQDCRYTMGNVADISGSHCPLDRPCERCKNESLQDKLKTDIKDLRYVVVHCIAEIQSLHDSYEQRFGGRPTITILNQGHAILERLDREDVL